MVFTPFFNSKPGKTSQDLVCVLFSFSFSPYWIKWEKGKGHCHLWSWRCFCPFKPVLLRCCWDILRRLKLRNLPIQKLSVSFSHWSPVVRVQLVSLVY